MITKKQSLWLLATLSLGSVALLAGCHHRRADAPAEKNSTTASPENASSNNENGVDLAVKQERREQFALQPGARVYVSGINGKVDISTAATDKADVYLVRSAKKAEDFEERQVTIERDQDGDLVIEIHNNRDRSVWAMLGSRHDERQRLELKLPRNVRLETRGINGDATIGELDGSLEVRGMNGKLKVARATTEIALSGINGNSEVGVANLSKEISLRGINGNIDLAFADAVNADIEMRGINGQINNELPNTVVKEQKQGRLEARIGNGGATIAGRGINGNISLLAANKK